MEKLYKIEFNENQLKVIAEACEFMSRFTSGQLDYFPSSFESWLWKKYPNVSEFCERRDRWKEGLLMTKEALFSEFGGSNGSYAIGSTEQVESAKTCYDIYRPILEQLHKDYEEEHPNETKHYGVLSHPGLSYSTDGRISIEKLNIRTEKLKKLSKK